MLQYSLLIGLPFLVGILLGYTWGRADGLDERLGPEDEDD